MGKNKDWEYLPKKGEYIRKRGGYYQCYCPICSHWFDGSDYLGTVFLKPKTLWLSNMVMHYRHSHITSWNKMWGYGGSYYRSAAHFGNYDEEKAKVNERAKSQIIRKAKDFIIENGINRSNFLELQNTTEETLGTYDNVILGKKKAKKKK